MAIFRVLLVREMSQALEIEADDLMAAAREALDENGLSANVSNDFDDSGEVKVYQVVSEAVGGGEEVVVFDFARDGEIDLS